MKNQYVLGLLLIGVLFSCNSSKETNEDANGTYIPTVTLLWETDSTLIASESVYYDAEKEVIYVSCIGDMPGEAKDGDGYMSIIDLDGNIINLKWTTGLDAPKGMAMVGRTLYVTDIDKLIGIDTETGEIISSELLENAKALNDLAASDNGDLYFTDASENTIYIKNAEGISVYYSDPELGGINGIFVDGNRLLIAGGEGIIWALSMDTLEKSIAAEGIAGGDGIEKYKDGHFVSCWMGRLFYFTEEGNIKIFDTSEEKINSADIDIIIDQDIMLVPTLFKNVVRAYRIE